jgi:outer membrane protein OmpA-like peptidoglycan-associated protein
VRFDLRTLFSILSFITLFAYAEENIFISMDRVDWTYSGNKKLCELEYNESPYGKFYFRSEERDKVNFTIKYSEPSNLANESVLFSVSAPWSQAEFKNTISHNKYNNQGQILFSHGIDRLIKDIQQGAWILIEFNNTKTKTQTRLSIPAVRIQHALKRFLACHDELPQMSYSRARTLDLYFASGESSLSPKQRNTLSAFYSYIKVADNINRLLIDGYSDRAGSSVVNLQLSRQRAQATADYLQLLGTAPTLIEVRAHGERYPFNNNVSNSTAKNRRVTVRLVRQDESVVKKHDEQ